MFMFIVRSCLFFISKVFVRATMIADFCFLKCLLFSRVFVLVFSSVNVSLSTGAIVGIVFGVIGGIILMLVLLLILKRLCRRWARASAARANSSQSQRYNNVSYKIEQTRIENVSQRYFRKLKTMLHLL